MIMIDTDALTLAKQIRTKAVSPVEVVEAVLQRIEALQPTINAFITVTADEAREAARRAEAALMAGEPLGPLHGVPFSVKDLLFTKGVRTTMGSVIFADQVPTEDAVPIRRLREAGAILTGKTTTPEFGHKPLTDSPLFGVIVIDGQPAGSIRGAWYPYTWPFNLSGHPAVSLPCGFTSGGLPIGLQIVGPWYADRRVLALAAHLERERPCARPMPL